MSGSTECSLPGGGRALTVGTFVLTVAAAAVLALGAQDVHLLRLGLVAALWAALLGAFAVARMRREASLRADRADELRAVYQLELEREVAARREHTLTIELTLREQAEQTERREIEALRAELNALRANLEHLLSRDALVHRVALPAEPARLVPLPTHFRAAAAAADAKAARSLSVAGSSVRAQDIPGLAPQDLRGPFRVGPGRSHPDALDDLTGNNGVSSAEISDVPRNGRHGASSWESSGSDGSYSNGSHTNGGSIQWAPEQASDTGTQRSVNDLLAAYGKDPAPRHRRSRDTS